LGQQAQQLLLSYHKRNHEHVLDAGSYHDSSGRAA
jgi:hypothetical protein